jgi:hypothetical protein
MRSRLVEERREQILELAARHGATAKRLSRQMIADHPEIPSR